ncbi:MAG: translation initiation factor IF-2 [Minisyncoccia bacterium]
MSKENKGILERPPIICITGHIDHGKSTLLDYIRKTNIVDTEAGGITQRISAYEVVHNGKKITFLDTPGHEAFGAMRARGVNIADIAVLVVSAEDGVKKQTLEAFKSIKDSNTPCIVVINKIDKPGSDITKTKNSLVENEIYIEGYGGNIPCVLVSAKTGQGVDELLDMMLLVAEVQELKGDTNKNAEGIVIEAFLDQKKGITATLVINDGKIKSGMYIACGESIAPTRMMENFLGKKITEAQFSSPVRIIGFDKLPDVGNVFMVFKDKKDAEEYCLTQKKSCSKFAKYEEDKEDTDHLNIIIKAGVSGTLDAISHEIKKIKNSPAHLSDKIKIRVVSSGIGDISESDVKTASAKAGAIIIGFDVKVAPTAVNLADRDHISIKIFDIIYKLTEWLEEEIIKRTPKEKVEEMSSRIKVLKVFGTVKDKHVFGGRVEIGTLSLGNEVKIMRRDIEIGRGKIKELQKEKKKTNEVTEGMEFGCQIQSTMTLAPGDKLEAFNVVEK